MKFRLWRAACRSTGSLCTFAAKPCHMEIETRSGTAARHHLRATRVVRSDGSLLSIAFF